MKKVTTIAAAVAIISSSAMADDWFVGIEAEERKIVLRQQAKPVFMMVRTTSLTAAKSATKKPKAVTLVFV